MYHIDGEYPSELTKSISFSQLDGLLAAKGENELYSPF